MGDGAAGKADVAEGRRVMRSRAETSGGRGVMMALMMTTALAALDGGVWTGGLWLSVLRGVRLRVWTSEWSGVMAAAA